VAAIEGRIASGARLGIGERLLSHGGAKLRLFAGLTAGICLPYFTLQRVQLLPPFSPPSAVIAFGALASKQHWAIDLAAGGALGAFADRIAWRPMRSEVS
jgi:membrane-associated phospholipid phosphatase